LLDGSLVYWSTVCSMLVDTYMILTYIHNYMYFTVGLLVDRNSKCTPRTLQAHSKPDKTFISLATKYTNFVHKVVNKITCNVVTIDIIGGNEIYIIH
jgi:hypothetical protein